MSAVLSLAFDQRDLLDRLLSLDDVELDALEFGVIGFDDETAVTVYNECESRLAGLAKSKTLTRPLFVTVAPCMNNYLVAQRFEDAHVAGESLDVTIDYVLTLKMRPAKVKLRLIASPLQATRFVLVNRLS
jgi:photoactive yellow protein